MIKYFAGDKVRITKAANYRIVDGPISSRGLNLMPGQTCILLVERDWPPSGVWHALHGRTTIFLHESDFELPCLLTTLARASAESWEL